MVLFSSEIEWIARVSSCHRKPPSLAVDTVLYSYQYILSHPVWGGFFFSFLILYTYYTDISHYIKNILRSIVYNSTVSVHNLQRA